MTMSLSMMEFLLRFLLFAFFAAIVCNGADIYNIYRGISDTVKIPTSICGKSDFTCGKIHYNAFLVEKCKCGCPYEAGTFGFHSGSWSCLDNTKVREQTDCGYKFESEYSESSPLQVVKKRMTPRPSTVPATCAIDFALSRYLKCDGTWTGLGLSEDSKMFEFELFKQRKNRDNSRTFELKMSKAKSSLAGRVVKLHVNCYSASKSSCLLFKISGEVRCPVAPKEQSKIASGQSGSSSGTVAAVVVVVTLVIIVIVVVFGVVIWKRKRGEADRMSSTERRALPTPKEEDEPDEQIYAEIPEQPITQSQTKTDAIIRGNLKLGLDTPNSISPRPAEKAGSRVPDVPSPTDGDGYFVPLDSPSYHVLENPGGAGRSDVADNDRYVTGQRRRRPPSPKGKGNEASAYINRRDVMNTGERRRDNNDGHGKGPNDKYDDYETLKDNKDDVSVYQALDRKAMSN